MTHIKSTSTFLKTVVLSISIFALGSLGSVSAFAASVELVHVPNQGEQVQQGQAKSETLSSIRPVGSGWNDSTDFNASVVSQCTVSDNESCLVNVDGTEVPAMSLLSGADSNTDMRANAEKNLAFKLCMRAELNNNGGNIYDAKLKCLKYWEN